MTDSVDLIVCVRCCHIPEYTSMKFRNNTGACDKHNSVHVHICNPSNMHAIKTAILPTFQQA